MAKFADDFLQMLHTAELREDQVHRQGEPEGAREGGREGGMGHKT